jgi:hypothetical protein
MFESLNLSINDNDDHDDDNDGLAKYFIFTWDSLIRDYLMVMKILTMKFFNKRLNKILF